MNTFALNDKRVVSAFTAGLWLMKLKQMHRHDIRILNIFNINVAIFPSYSKYCAKFCFKIKINGFYKQKNFYTHKYYLLL